VDDLPPRVELLEEVSIVEVVDSGFQGVPGLTAYELAVIHGYLGTETQWLASLQGNQNVLILQHNEVFDPSTPPDTAVFRYRS
jgi:hypothetical protein